MALVRNIQKMINYFAKSPRFDRTLNGVKVIQAEQGKVTCELEVKEEHLNGHGTMHGGMLATLVDVVSTYAIGTAGENKLGVTVDLSVSYMSAAVPGDKVTIKSEVLKAGKNLAFANVDIYKQNGVLMATGRHTKYLNL